LAFAELDALASPETFRPSVVGATVVALACLASNLGCGSHANQDDGLCAQRSGTYRTKFTQRTGTCGNIPENISTIDEQPVVPPKPCTDGEIRYSADNCEVTNIDITCPEDGIQAAAVSVVNGKYTWTTDASGGTGQANFVIKTEAGSVICQSSYDVEITRL
jgi:hypothetical protein